jgi:hypothetical protein
MAPVLTRLFTPLSTILLLVFLGTMGRTGRPIDIEREVLMAFDLLLALAARGERADQAFTKSGDD